ncbi:GtrA family protein [Candidatus Parcubacteria bacterium]|nr:GtrA family protein [Patescibacteria group bacterium]MBU4309263.1 GtrA family protein [Patescibacteria group bacterium]MBU4432492.1 GtrA family protein [Patescibacteria group bacterium]MBU4577624.1 GtrA family protein [Patescibacteria group bacterium]MCG2697310.1 GtrA family protein [Candidatus Parcubacteria bacterium]
MDYLLNLLHKNKIYIKFAISGTTATLAELWLLYLLHGVWRMGLILSSTIAFAVAFSISFSLQKFWTFRNANIEKIPRQLSIYLFVGTTNLVLNAVIVHEAVRKFHIYYLLAQLVSTILLSIWSFLMNKFVIFEKEHREKKLKKKFGERDKQRFFILVNEEDVVDYKPAEDCEYRGIVFGKKDYKMEIPNFRLVVRTKNRFLNFIKIFYQTRKWIHWSDKVKCYCLGEIALPGYAVAKLAGKKFILQIKDENRPKGWYRKIIKDMEEVIS